MPAAAHAAVGAQDARRRRSGPPRGDLLHAGTLAGRAVARCRTPKPTAAAEIGQSSREGSIQVVASLALPSAFVRSPGFAAELGLAGQPREHGGGVAAAIAHRSVHGRWALHRTVHRSSAIDATIRVPVGRRPHRQVPVGMGSGGGLAHRASNGLRWRHGAAELGINLATRAQARISSTILHRVWLPRSASTLHAHGLEPGGQVRHRLGMSARQLSPAALDTPHPLPTTCLEIHEQLLPLTGELSLDGRHLRSELIHARLGVHLQAGLLL